MKKEIANIAKYFLVYLGIQLIVSGIIISITNSLSLGEGGSEAPMVIISSVASNIVALIVFLACRWQRFSLDFFSDRTNAAVLLACVLISIGTLIPAQFLEELIPEQYRQDLLKDMFQQIMTTSYGYIAICIFAPLVEEMVFRGAIQGAAQRALAPQPPKGEYLKNVFLLKKVPGHWYAIIITALLFALIHGNPAQMPHAFIIGLLLGWLRYRSGSIMPGVVVHWVNNTAAYMLAFFYPQSMNMEVADFFGGDDLRLGGAIAFSLVGLFIGIMEVHMLLRNKAIIEE